MGEWPIKEINIFAIIRADDMGCRHPRKTIFESIVKVVHVGEMPDHIISGRDPISEVNHERNN
jgi:hypothetical protein